MTSDPERTLSRSLGPPCTAAGALARGVPGVGPGCSCRTAHLVHLVQPVLVGGQLSHERLVLLPLGVQVAGLVVGHVLGRQHLLIDPELQLDGQRPGREEGPRACQREGRGGQQVGAGERGEVADVGRGRAGRTCSGTRPRTYILGSESRGAVEGTARACRRGRGTEPHLMTILQEMLLLSVVPEASQKLLHGFLVLLVSVTTAPCDAPALAVKGS